MRRLASTSVLAIAALAAACSSLLGIEEVHEGPEPGAQGADGGTSSGTSGASGAGRGGAGMSGQGGMAGTAVSGRSGLGGTTGGATSGSGGEAAAGRGGNAGTATGGTGGVVADGGTAGTGGAEDSTVRGKVVSYWLQPIEDVHVMIGDASAETNDEGEFEIPGVADTYDAMFVVNYARNGANTASYGWVYEGLTRRDPILQVYGGLDDQSGEVFIVPTATFDTSRRLIVGIGSDYGEGQNEIASSEGRHGSMPWNGPQTLGAVGHGLLWNIDENGLPTTYLAYATEPVTLNTTSEANLYLDMPDAALDSGTISGSVISPTVEDRENRVFLRFTTNANIELAWDYGMEVDPNEFSYTVPAVASASITVSAAEGSEFSGAAAVVHRDGLAAGQGGIELTIPSPPVLVAPPDDDVIDDDTIFSWSGDAETFVWHAEDQDAATFAGLYIVTSRKQITLPTFPNGFRLAANNSHNWRVETHGSAANVDELAGPQGFADSFAQNRGESPAGPRRDSEGSYTISSARWFTPAP